MRAIVTVLGKDRVGIMSLVCALLAQLGEAQRHFSRNGRLATRPCAQPAA